MAASIILAVLSGLSFLASICAVGMYFLLTWQGAETWVLRVWAGTMFGCLGLGWLFGWAA